MKKRIMKWLSESNRWKHLAGGFVLGMANSGLYGAALTSLTAASCLEYKDKAWGGKWDWTDWTLTIVGGVLGAAIRT